MDTPNTPAEDKNHLKSWLDTIQQNSWQLELLISGFAVFLLFECTALLKSLEYSLTLLQQTMNQFEPVYILYVFCGMAINVLLVCLLFHVSLRGLWIAAVGLRSVSGDIEYDSFRYRPIFSDRLRGRIGSFDDYIDRLEKICSAVFSLAFLIIFCFIGVATYLCMMVLTLEFVSWLTNVPDNSKSWDLVDTVAIIYLIVGLLYLIDFVSLGALKRVRWWRKTYYYFYVFMGWITLARFYRPIYYNLIDMRFGRQFARLLPVLIFATMAIASLKFSGHAYYPNGPGDGTYMYHDNFYEDRVVNRTAHVWRPSITSRYADGSYLELFIPYVPTNDDPYLELIYPELKPARKVGIYLEGIIGIGSRGLPGSEPEQLLEAFDSKYRVFVNDSLQQISPRFYYHDTREQRGLLYPIPVYDLPRGEHRLRIDERQLIDGEPVFNAGQTHYFYR